MSDKAAAGLSPRGSIAEIEHGAAFMPKFDADGLIPAIVTDHTSGEVVMFAFMNRQALAATLQTGLAHFWSRSRNKLWRKGEESGNTLKIVEMRTDCDQDVVWLRVDIQGDGVACHTGAASCFYRSIPLHQSGDGGTILEPVEIRRSKPA